MSTIALINDPPLLPNPNLSLADLPTSSWIGRIVSWVKEHPRTIILSITCIALGIFGLFFVPLPWSYAGFGCSCIIPLIPIGYEKIHTRTDVEAFYDLQRYENYRFFKDPPEEKILRAIHAKLKQEFDDLQEEVKQDDAQVSKWIKNSWITASIDLYMRAMQIASLLIRNQAALRGKL